MLLHDDLYADMDPDYKSSNFFKDRTRLLSTVESNTILPEHGLNARSLLDESQLQKVTSIRKRRLRKVMDRFIQD